MNETQPRISSVLLDSTEARISSVLPGPTASEYYSCQLAWTRLPV